MQGPDTDAQDQPPPFFHIRLATHGRSIQMARSTNAPCKGRIQMRKTNPLHFFTFGLQRTAGPYRWPGAQTLHARAGYRCARPTPSIFSHSACNARPVHTVGSKPEKLNESKCFPLCP